MRFFTVALLSIPFIILGFGNTAYAVDLTDIGHLVAGDTTGNGVSTAGTVVGGSDNVGGNVTAFRWTSDGGMVSLGTLGGTTSEAFRVSADGSIAVGVSKNVGGNDRAFRWTEAGGMVDLGTLGGAEALAYDISADGSTIVGLSEDAGGFDQSFLWTQAGGMTLIPPVAGGLGSIAYGVNADGTAVVGVSDDGAFGQAFLWTAGGGSQFMGNLGLPISEAYDVSADGTVVVGMGVDINFNNRAFRWTQATGMVDLGDLGGSLATAYAVSGDGNKIVGVTVDSDGNDLGFVWTDMGMRSINDMLTSAGVDLTGLTIEEAQDISADGDTIVGNGRVGGIWRSFLIREAGITTCEELFDSLGELSAVASDISYMAMGTMRAIMDQADHLPDNTGPRLWMVGSLLGDTAMPGSDMGGEGGFGITTPLGPGLSLGTGVFMGRRNVDTKYGGSQISSMFGPGAFLSYAPNQTGWRAKVGVLYERASLELNRAYPNGASTTVADGETDGHVFSMSSHLGWLQPLSETVAIQPYVEYELQASLLDAYTETDTPFPAHFKERRDVMNKARLGIESRYTPSSILDIWGWAAWSHRFERKGPGMDGYLVGMTNFSYSGGAVDQDWGEIGGGIKYRPSANVETFSRITLAVGNDHYAAPDAALNTGVAWTF